MENHGAPSSASLLSALSATEARALFDGPERRVHLRVGGLDGRLYLDLCDATWRVIEIDSSGWRVTDNPPIRFRRSSGMRPLPLPVAGGSITALRNFLNVHTDQDFVLVVSWALACLRDRGPYPVLVLSGEQGSAKSSFSAILRALLDPNAAPLRALPREDRDFFIAATNAHLLAYDNLSGLPGWLSDTLCRLATGGGFAIRQLFSDQGEVLFEAARPVILNGIEDIVTRPDLADRALFLSLKPISEEHRRPEADLWVAFEAERPLILGALLDAVVEGLRNLPTTQLPKLPRLADFALWATACETRFWSTETFWASYCGNLEEAIDDVIDADPVASSVRSLLETRAGWSGTATTLLPILCTFAGDKVARSRSWPENARALANRLRRAATFLRKAGITVNFEREGHSRTRIIHLTVAPPSTSAESAATFASAPSSSSSPATPPFSTAASPELSPPTETDAADYTDTPLPPETSVTARTNHLISRHYHDADDADANSPPPFKPQGQGRYLWEPARRNTESMTPTPPDQSSSSSAPTPPTPWQRQFQQMMKARLPQVSGSGEKG